MYGELALTVRQQWANIEERQFNVLGWVLIAVEGWHWTI